MEDFYDVAYVTPQTKEKLEKLLKKYDGKNFTDIHRFLNDAYNNSDKDKSNFCLKFKLGEFEEVSYYAVCEKNKHFDKQEWCLNKIEKYDAIKNSNINDTNLKRFAWLGNEENFLEEIANLALNENWTYKDSLSPVEKNNVLKNYLNTTFTFLCGTKNGIVESKDKEYCAFNTGLVDDVYDDIYLIFQKFQNRNQNKDGWKYKYVCCTTKRKTAGKKYLDNFKILPEKANYAKISDLFLVPGKVNSDFEHILEDNFERFPIDFIKRELSPVQAFVKFYETHPKNTEIKNFILDNQECKVRISYAFESSVDQSVRRWNWNYKTAVPMYFPTEKKIQFLLPLYFSPDTKKLDAALVIDKTERESEYRGVTILTPVMAYLDARLLCRPDSDWLGIPEN